jgi:hypothetical protein
MKKLLSIVILIITIANYKSQNGQGSYTFQLASSIKAPQTSDFIRHGNIPVNKFVGEPNLEIPLFKLKANQLGDDLSVSLGYNFSGFIPSKRPDIAGLNWFLNVGGVITRQVNSIPDDQKGESATNGPSHGMNKDGLIVGLRSKNNCLPLHSNIGIFSFSSSVGGFNVMDLDYKLNGCDIYTAYDGDADTFSFNFGGYSGKFFVGNDNQIKIIGENVKGFKIDISNVATQPYTNICKPLSSEIKITDDKGNLYFFGGESKNLEYNVPLSHIINQPETKAGLPVINAWYLKQIQYNNGEIVNFNYKDDSILSNGFCNGSSNTIDWHGIVTNPTIQERRKFIIYNKSYNQDVSCVSNPGATGDLNYSTCGGSELVYSVTKKAILENITTSSYSINLKYSLQPYIFNNEQSDVSYFQQIKNIKLDSISLYSSGGKFINKFELDYQLLGGNTNAGSYPRLFLNSIKESNKNPYTFSYNISNENLPKAASKQIDHWGFYNGNTGNEYLPYPVPNQVTDQLGDYYFTNDVRYPDISFSSKGILTEVIYPTKGSTVFEFEAPTYDYRIERKRINGFLPSLLNYSGTAGGVRVKKISDYTDGVLVKEKQYQYSNGILLQWPRYVMLLYNGVNSFVWMRSSSMNLNTLESSIINYGRVDEIETNKGMISSNYSNYQSHPDRNDSNIIVNSNNPLSVATNLDLAKNYIGLYYNDLSLERGKLLFESVYDNLGRILKYTSLTYNINPNRFDEYSAVFHLSGPAAQANKKYYYSTNLTKKETHEYFYDSGQPRETLTTENYTYSGAPDYQPIGQQTVFADGSVNEVSTKFAYQDGNTLMINKNMIAIPVENTVVLKKNISDAGKIISHDKNVYPTSLPTTQTGNLVLPYSALSYDLQNISIEEMSYNKYDGKGNLQQYTTKDGISTTIIWGYNQTQPIAKIVGAKLSDIQQSLIDSIVNASTIDEAAAPMNDETSFLTVLDAFRKDGSLSNYQVTTYSYDPLVGVRSITPPSGLREIYLYDTANRLKEIKQMEKDSNNQLIYKTVKEFTYNYKQ